MSAHLSRGKRPSCTAVQTDRVTQVAANDGQTRRRLANRERLFAAAVDLITAHGYEATTMDGIAARAGMSRRTTFNHFATKGDITVEWARRRRARAATAAHIPGDTGILDGLRAYFHELAVITESHPTETREMLLGFLGVAGPVFHRTPMGSELGVWMAAASTDPARSALAAEMLYDVYMGTLFRWMHDESPPEGAFAAALDQAIDIALHGVATILEPPQSGVDSSDCSGAGRPAVQ